MKYKKALTTDCKVILPTKAILPAKFDTRHQPKSKIKRQFCGTFACGGKTPVEVTGWRHLVVRVKQKINPFKELLESKIR